MDTELLNENVRIERKHFTFNLRENMRGRFLRITEDVGGRRDTIIIPSTGLDEIHRILEHAMAVNREAGPCESHFES